MHGALAARGHAGFAVRMSGSGRSPVRPRRIVVLTGAGISAESGIPTFRDAGGLWEGHRPEEVATPEAFAADSGLVHRFYNRRRRDLAGCEPNAAHRALADLERRFDGEFLLVTQNIDDLHERAGSRRVLHMHGELRKMRCTRCRAVREPDGDLSVASRCPACSAVGSLRPDVVWFGEIPFFLEEIGRAVTRCDLFVAIGTSGLVYPAAGFVDLAAAAGADTLEINTAATGTSPRFRRHRIGPAGVEVPAWVEEAAPRSP